MRTESHPIKRVVSCTGHTTEDQAEQRQAGALGAAVLLIVGMLAASYYVPPAAGQAGGYQTPPVTLADSPMVTPSPMSFVVWQPVRLWLPMVARRDAR